MKILLSIASQCSPILIVFGFLAGEKRLVKEHGRLPSGSMGDSIPCRDLRSCSKFE